MSSDTLILWCDRTDSLLKLSTPDLEHLTSKPGDYRLSLTCQNFLGYTSDFSVSLGAHGTPVPPVTIVGPMTRKFLISEGLRIKTYVDHEAICPGDTVVYEWIRSTEDELSFPGTSKKDLVLQKVQAIAQKTYDFTLIVHLVKPDGTRRSGSKTIVVEATAVGSDIIPGILGPEGDVVLTQDLVLTADCYDPDDPENARQAFSYEYSCIRSLSQDTIEQDETSTEICPSYGIVEGAQVTLPKTSLRFNVWHTYTVTCSKASTYTGAPTVVRSGSASKKFIPRPPESPIPTAKIRQQCASTKCPARNNPEKPIVLLLEDFNYPDALVEWTCTGNTITEANTKTGLKRRVLIIKKNVVKPGGEVECIAALERMDAASVMHSGEARITLQMNAGPFCAADKCLTVDLVSTNNVFPSAKFMLSVSDFMDDQDSLEFSFGCIHANHQKIQQQGPQTLFVLSSLSVGTHTCFACAIDRLGTHLCEYADLEVVGPIGGVSIEEAAVALNDVEEAKKSGDPAYVLDMVVRATNILQYGAGGRRLLSTNQDSADALIDTIAEEIEGLEPFDLTVFQTSIDALADLSSRYTLDSANVAMRAVEYGIKATQDELSEIDLGNILKIVSAHSHEWSMAEMSNMEIANEYVRINNIIGNAILLMCDQSLPGEQPKVAVGVDTSLAGGICLKEFTDALSNQQFAVGAAKLQFPADAFSHASNNEQLHITATYISNSSVHSDLFLGTSDLEANSGIMNVGISSRDAVCDMDDCWLLVTMPLHNHDPDKETACIRIHNGMVVGLTGVDGVWTVPDSYNINTNTIVCNITMLGEVMLVSFPKPEPIPETLSPPSPAGDMAIPPTQTDNSMQDAEGPPPPEGVSEAKPDYDKKVRQQINSAFKFPR